MLFTLSDYEVQAQKKLTAMAYHYYSGGARDEITLKQNRQAWDEISLHYRVLVDVSHRTIKTQFLNQTVSSPILVAPTAFHGLAHSQGECETALGAHTQNQIYIASTLSNRSINVHGSKSMSGTQTNQLWHYIQHLLHKLYPLSDRLEPSLP